MPLLSFLPLLTILSSILVIFFEVTTLTSWLVLGLSLILTLRSHRTVILNVIQNPDKTNEQKKNDRFLGFLFSLPDSRRRGNDGRRRNDISGDALRFTLYALLGIGIALFYSRHQSTSSNPLVWTILPSWFLPVLMMVTFISLLSIPTRERNIPFSSFLFPSLFLILPILFPLGTDYDPFVHRAAEQTIVEQGSLQPRTILYSGEYGLVSVISTLTHIPVKQVNLFLLPLLVILVIPPLLRKTVKGPSPVLFFLLPFSPLTTTVPQSLGIFFLFLLVCLRWQHTHEKKNVIPDFHPESKQQTKRKKIGIFSFLFDSRDSRRRGNDNHHDPFPLTLCLFLALAAFLCHPFPGIAAFLFLGWNIVLLLFQTLRARFQNKKDGRMGKISLRTMLAFSALMTFVASTLALPGALIFNNRLDSQFAITSIRLNPEAPRTIASLIAPGWIRYTDPLSFIHFFGKNYYLFFFIVIALGTVHKMKKMPKQTHPSSSDLLNPPNVGSRDNENIILPPLLSFLSILGSSLIVLCCLQPNVTPAEHIQLFTRLFSLSLIFLWPLFLNHGSWIMNHESKKTFRLSCVTFLSVLIVSNIYLQFPHSDRFVNFKGYLTSQDDLNTVQQIEKRASKPYLVLANQSVGAAALDQFGFSQYVNQWSVVNDHHHHDAIMRLSKGRPSEKQYFYSIPISSKSHEYFLRMTKAPSRALIEEIFQTYEMNELYLVLNDYWKNSARIAENLKPLSEREFRSGANTIFVFQKTSSRSRHE